MKIGLHNNQLDGRGTGKAIYDFGVGLRDLLRHDITFISSKQHANEQLNVINRDNFKTILYDMPTIGNQQYQERLKTKQLLSDIVTSEHLDFMFFLKSGHNDNVTPENCKTGIQCVFTMNESHGNIYAAVSHYVARKFNQTLWAPASILKNYEPTQNLRVKYNIPTDALVIGRHGGKDTFNIPFVKTTIQNILSHRKDIYFVFLSTEKFIEHERVVFIPWVETEQEKFNFIHICDAMLHARIDGETFGTAIAEFSVANKPVITYSGVSIGGYDTCHLELLNNKAIIYNNEQELNDILFSIDKPFINSNNWDMYSSEYNQKSVITRFKEVYLS